MLNVWYIKQLKENIFGTLLKYMNTQLKNETSKVKNKIMLYKYAQINATQ